MGGKKAPTQSMDYALQGGPMDYALPAMKAGAR